MGKFPSPNHVIYQCALVPITVCSLSLWTKHLCSLWFEVYFAGDLNTPLSSTAHSLVWLGVNVLVFALGLVLVGWLPRLQRGRGFKHWLLCRGVEREITHMKGKRAAFHLFLFYLEPQRG